MAGMSGMKLSMIAIIFCNGSGKERSFSKNLYKNIKEFIPRDELLSMIMN